MQFGRNAQLSISYLNENGATDPNSAVGNAGAALLLANVTDTRNMLKEMSISLPVGVYNASISMKGFIDHLRLRYI